MDTVTRKDFVRNVKKYLVEGEFYLMNRGKPEYLIKVQAVDIDGFVAPEKKDHVAEAKEFIKDVQEKSLEEKSLTEYYGCLECKRDGVHILCVKHGRY